MRIAFALSQNMLATSMSWPTEMWFAAQQAAQKQLGTNTVVEMDSIAANNDKIQCHANIQLHANQTFDESVDYDLIYLPALWRNPRPVVRRETAMRSWLQKQYENGAKICAVGTGCCLLAATGLLDHKPATTHWYYFDQFQRDFPLVELKRQHFITEAGSLYCAASINSLADLTIHFIQSAFGLGIAQHVERHFSHEIRQSYDTSSYVEKHNANHPDETILQTQLWLQGHLANDISIARLAIDYGMSERNFCRRFKKATGQSPSHYLQTIRINSAQDLLQYSNLSISEIADRTGFSDLSYFAKVFKKHRSISPRDYRATVRAKLFTSAEK